LPSPETELGGSGGSGKNVRALPPPGSTRGTSFSVVSKIDEMYHTDTPHIYTDEEIQQVLAQVLPQFPNEVNESWHAFDEWIGKRFDARAEARKAANRARQKHRRKATRRR